MKSPTFITKVIPETSVNLYCGSEALWAEAVEVIGMDRIDVQVASDWTVVIDVPVGLALNIAKDFDPARLIIFSGNTCAEYKLDLLAFKPYALVGDTAVRKLAEAIRLAQNGEVLQPNITSPLSPTERLTLQLVAKGYTNKEIARLRNISPGVVRNTVKTLYLKLGLKSRLHATSYYFGNQYFLKN